MALFKRLENIEANDIDYGNLFYRSGDNDELRFSAYRWLASCRTVTSKLKLSKGRIVPIKADSRRLWQREKKVYK